MEALLALFLLLLSIISWFNNIILSVSFVGLIISYILDFDYELINRIWQVFMYSLVTWLVILLVQLLCLAGLQNK